MGEKLSILGVCLMAGAVGGCAGQPPQPEQLISTALVVNSVKCGFALALAEEKKQNLPKDKQRLHGNIATVQLRLKVADTRTASGGIGAKSGVIAWTGGSIAPSLSLSQSQAWTVDTVLNASYKLDATNTRVCEAARVTGQAEYADPFGFSRWLSNTIVELSKVSLEPPTGQLDKMTYDAIFGVTKNAEGKVPLTLAFLDANVSGSINRVDTQQITVVISGAPVVITPKAGAAPPTAGLGPLAVPPGARIRNLSEVPPALE